MKLYVFISIAITCICVAMLCLYDVILQQSTSNDDRPHVVCTTTIIADTIANIAADTVQITPLMGPGVDPHSYKPIENDLYKIAQADLIVYHGLHLEARMADLFMHLKNTKNVCCVSDDIPKDLLISSDENPEIFDPHIWFDPNLWIYAVKKITNDLIQLCSQHKALYEKNSQHFIDKINAVFHQTFTKLTSIPAHKRYLITSHDAFSYFAKSYKFNVISLCGINTTSEAGITDVQAVIQAIIAHHIPTIFVESCIPPRSMQAIMQAVIAQHHQVKIGQELYADSLGTSNSPANSYINMINYNIDTILTGLSS